MTAHLQDTLAFVRGWMDTATVRPHTTVHRDSTRVVLRTPTSTLVLGPHERDDLNTILRLASL